MNEKLVVYAYNVRFGEAILVEVPDGRHDLSVVLDCTTAQCAALRILIPESAVTNGS